MSKPMTNGIRRIAEISDYEPFIGAASVDRIRSKAEALSHLHVVHVNSTHYGGGVAELLDGLTLLMNSTGVETGWRVLQGAPDYFSITKKMHNALQGGEINLSDLKKEIYEDVVFKNAYRTHLEDHNMVVIHDPQPLPMIRHFRKSGPWIWHAHIDLTEPNLELWDYLSDFIEEYDAVVMSSEEYQADLATPQRFIMPAIDPFSIKNKELSAAEIEERLEHYDIPTDLPIVTQISRFDRWKDPAGVIEAFKIARREVDATLVLLGQMAGDDPEGQDVYESLLDEQEDRIIILSQEDTALVNALQRHAAVVLQKSIREGFGLTVAEALWKEAAVIGGDVGGIRYQIDDGENGFLVSSVEQAAERIVQLLKDEELRTRLGRAGREKVKKHFLLSRMLEEYLDLFTGFHAHFDLE